MPPPALRKLGRAEASQVVGKLQNGQGKIPAPCLKAFRSLTAGVVMTEFSRTFPGTHGAVRSAPETEIAVCCLLNADNTFWYLFIFCISSMCLIFNDLRAGFYGDCPGNCITYIPVAVGYPIDDRMVSVLEVYSIPPQIDVGAVK